MADPREALSVSQVNEYIRLLIDSDPVLGEICVRGEISNFKNHYATGHYYLSLKDEKSVISCVMFSGNASRLKFVPQNGMKVIVYGRVSVFPKSGAYQIYISSMVPDGIGELFIAFEQLKAKLGAEGLFDPSRKKKLPKYPSAIGLVTSASGAAVRDLCNVLGRRFPVARVLIYPALVQGSGAAESVAAGIRYFNEKKNVNVIIIGRGGGSVEDLWSFNDEMLARTIAASGLPVISAVGHEVDFTISDFVADQRAPTPSAAAELAVPDGADLLRRLANAERRCALLAGQKITRFEERLRTMKTTGVLSSPERSLELREAELARSEDNLCAGYRTVVARTEKNLLSVCSRLEAMNPLAVLSRGYAAVSSGEGVVTDAARLSEGDPINVRFRDGEVLARVEKILCTSEVNENG